MLKKGDAARLPKAYAGAIVEAWRRFKRGDATKEEAATVAERIAATYAGFNACGPAVTAICDACGDFALRNAPTNVDILEVYTKLRLVIPLVVWGFSTLWSLNSYLYFAITTCVVHIVCEAIATAPPHLSSIEAEPAPLSSD